MKKKKLTKLPQVIVNQIAAGEVVERPSSVVKELVDNAIDAEASKITIRVKNGGIDMIEVSDNGYGIPKEELPLIFDAHTTSKIETIEDLNTLISMGFRGEALSSITSVAKVSVTSKSADEEIANEIIFNKEDRLYQEALSDPELKRTQVELDAALSNSREARQVVFDLFQDLEGFSLDDYKPFADVSSSLDRLVHFFAAAVADRQQKLLKIDDETYDLVTVDGVRRARFTLSRDAATSHDDLELMGLDHPLVQEELGRWCSVPPEDIGIAVTGDMDTPVLLSLWMVEASAGNGERRVVVQPIAVKQDGTRVPAVERQYERYLQAPATAPRFLPEQRLELFIRAVEPTLQRELRHKGTANGDGSYSAEMIGYVEVLPLNTGNPPLRSH